MNIELYKRTFNIVSKLNLPSFDFVKGDITIGSSEDCLIVRKNDIEAIRVIFGGFYSDDEVNYVQYDDNNRILVGTYNTGIIEVNGEVLNCYMTEEEKFQKQMVEPLAALST